VIKSWTYSDDGVSVKTDLSKLTVKQTLFEPTFWHALMMLTLSLSFCFFIKVAYKSYGSTIYTDDHFLTQAGNRGFIAAATSKFICGFLG
jgi:hypothetical protein